MKQGIPRSTASPDRPSRARRPNPALQAALSAALGVGAAHAESASPLSWSSFSIIAQKVVSRGPDMNTSWFRAALKHKNPINAETSRMEDLVLTDAVPLDLQIRFFEQSFGSNGHLTREFMSKELSAERLSLILKMVDRFNARINREYGLRDKIPSRIPLFSQVASLEAATKVIRVPATESGAFCNSFFYQVEEGAGAYVTRQDTAAHCGMIELMKMGYTVSSTGADVATREVSRLETGIDPAHFPIMRELRFPEVYGKLGVSVSWSPRGEKKVQFSIVMPLTERVQELGLAANVNNPSSYHRGSLFILKPRVEGAVIGTHKRTGKPVLEASGSSGSLIAIAGKRPVVLGSFTDEKILWDTCTNLCYAISVGNGPSIHADVRAQAKQENVGAWAADVKEAFDTTKKTTPA